MLAFLKIYPQKAKLSEKEILVTSVSDPDPVGSGFKSPVWIRIRNPDPAIEIEPFLKLWKAVLIG